MADTPDTALSRIHDLATAALNEPGTPPAVTQALEQIAALAGDTRGDTPEASDTPRTDNQSL